MLSIIQESMAIQQAKIAKRKIAIIRYRNNVLMQPDGYVLPNDAILIAYATENGVEYVQDSITRHVTVDE